MKIMAINGSPRKNWNTDTLLKNVLDGAASVGAETEMVYLYDLKFRGCVSCMACKLQNGKNLGRCVQKDELTPVLERTHEADVVVLGSPIYFSEVTGGMRSFIERFLFQYLNYDDYSKPLSPTKRTALVFTMNIPETMLNSFGYRALFQRYEDLMRLYFKDCTMLLSTDTMQVKDYSRYHLAGFDAEAKRQRHETVFPQDCKKGFELGVKLVSGEETSTDALSPRTPGVPDDPVERTLALHEYPIALETFESMYDYTLRRINAKEKRAILKDLLQLYPVLGSVCENAKEHFKETEKHQSNEVSDTEAIPYPGSAPELILTIMSAFTPTTKYPICDKGIFNLCKLEAMPLVSAFLKKDRMFDSMLQSFDEPHLIRFICGHVATLDFTERKKREVMKTMVAWGLLLSCARHEQLSEQEGNGNEEVRGGKEEYDFDREALSVLQLHVKLVGYKVSADVLVREDSTFEDLHDFITELFERDDDHLYRFECKDGLIAVRPEEIEESLEDGDDDNALVLSRDCYVGHHLFPGCGAYYVFDYGDYWEHDIQVKNVLPADPDEHYPKIIKIKGEIPEQYPDCDDEDDEN